MPEPDLSDPAYAAFAWARFRRILGWMALLALVAGIGGVAILHVWVGPLPIHVAIASFLGIALSILMAALLMGLMFLSSGSGHDARIDDLDTPDA